MGRPLAAFAALSIFQRSWWPGILPSGHISCECHVPTHSRGYHVMVFPLASRRKFRVSRKRPISRLLIPMATPAEPTTQIDDGDGINNVFSSHQFQKG
jgi:hypothetical protein